MLAIKFISLTGYCKKTKQKKPREDAGETNKETKSEKEHIKHKPQSGIITYKATQSRQP